MKRYFWGTFAAFWVTIVLTLVLTVFFGSFVSTPERQVSPLLSDYFANAATAVDGVIATESNPAEIAQVLSEHEQKVADVSLFLIDSDGVDIQRRPLPLPVRRIVTNTDPVLAREMSWQDPRILYVAKLEGDFRLIAHESGIQPFARAIDEPLERLVLLFFIVVVSLVASYVVAVFTARRLKRVAVVARAAVAGELTVRAGEKVRGKDLTAQLAQDIDTLIEKRASTTEEM